jgi:hypothetical protein
VRAVHESFRVPLPADRHSLTSLTRRRVHVQQPLGWDLTAKTAQRSNTTAFHDNTPELGTQLNGWTRTTGATWEGEANRG